MFRRSLLFAIIAGPVLVAADLPPDHGERMTRGLEMFQKDVRQLLVENCVKCHGGEKTKSEFDMATREGLLAGGKNGVAVIPFDTAGSRVMKLLRHAEDPHMPDKKPRLPADVIAKIGAWIDHGAPYDGPLVAGKLPPRDRSKVSADDRKWWSFQPLSNPAIPAGAANPIDAFLLAKSAEKKLTLNPRADPRAIIRRACLDVTGLPPTAEEVEDFVKESTIDYPLSVIHLTDRLLASPHYGERWGRHWLDVARFAESSGFEHDYDRPNAWHYRDFVIKALNADMPFDQFVDWQIAGDEFAPGNVQAMMATGFLGAGVFPTQITANEVERVRYDAMDDMLSTTGSAMLGLTIGCARCHDHKYDPIPTQDYYRMLSTFTTTVRSNIDLDTDPDRSAKLLAQHKEEQAKLTAELTSWENSALRPKFDAWLAAKPDTLPSTAWVMAEGSISSKDGATFKTLPDGSWLAEGANPASDVYTITASVAARESSESRGTHEAYFTALKLEALADSSMKNNGPGRADNGNFALSRIRMMAEPLSGGPVQDVRLKPGEFTHQQNASGLSVASSLDDDPKSGWAVDGQIGKDHAAIFTFAEPVSASGGVTLTITLEFSVNTGHNIGRPRLSFCQGGPPALNAPALPANIAALTPKLAAPETLKQGERDTLFTWWKQRYPGWQERQQKIATHAKGAPNPLTPVMVCVEGYEPLVMHSQGPPFLMETHVLKRGDTNQKAAPATQSFLQVLMRDADEKHWQWSPPAGAKSTGRRRALAQWMRDVEHGAGALLARVAVNRLWQHHFGRGIVATPSDFGKTGAPPTHPELLDWLAGDLIRNGWKLKSIHRLILTSEAYRQSAAADSAKLAADPDNTLFLRAIPRRLEAEAARDAMLAVSGQLDRTPFGPGTLDENSRRRSIYFKVKRSQLVNSMVVFDAPEPLVSQGTRPSTTVAPQALFLMNSPQVCQWSAALAANVWTLSPPSAGWIPRIHHATRQALGRPATPGELQVVAPFLEQQTAAHRAAGHADAGQQALTDFCQTLFGLNEFLYVP